MEASRFCEALKRVGGLRLIRQRALIGMIKEVSTAFNAGGQSAL